MKQMLFCWRDGQSEVKTEFLGRNGTQANPGHVVMYLGGGQVIQAPRAGQDVQAGPLDLAGVVAATRPADLATTP